MKITRRQLLPFLSLAAVPLLPSLKHENPGQVYEQDKDGVFRPVKAIVRSGEVELEDGKHKVEEASSWQ